MKIKKFVLPDGLRKEVYGWMREVVNTLEQKELLDNVDVAALAMLAINYDLSLQALDAIRKEGIVVPGTRGCITKNPAFDVYKNSCDKCLQIMKEFGLTAKSRVKMPNNDKDISSPLDQFIKGNVEKR